MNDADKARYEIVTREYAAALHAMQSGVKQEIYNGHPELPDPIARFLKHERVGVNSALVETSVLQGLLIKRGLFTEIEHMEALRDEMRREVQRYEERLSKILGITVRLG